MRSSPGLGGSGGSSPGLSADAPAPALSLANGITTAKAQMWILTASILTGVIYGFRRMIEPATPSTKKGASKAAALLGAGPTPPLENWVISYGVAFFMLSVLALGAPELAAGLALLGLTANLLANGLTIAADITGLEGTVVPAATTNTGVPDKLAGSTAQGAANAAGATAKGANNAASTVDKFTSGF